MRILMAWAKAKMASRKNQKGVVFIEYLALAAAIAAATATVVFDFSAFQTKFNDIVTSI